MGKFDLHSLQKNILLDILPINQYFRDTRDYKSRIEAYSREMLRKEAQIKDLQSRVENGDGSKYFFSIILSFSDSVKCPNLHIFYVTLVIMVGMAIMQSFCQE